MGGEAEDLARGANESSLGTSMPRSSANQVCHLIEKRIKPIHELKIVKNLQLPVPQSSGAEPKVCELEMARGGEQHVVWLDVPVHDATLVQVLQGEDHGSEVEDSLVLWKAAIHAEEGLEVAANHVLHHHEHVVGRLQTIKEGNTELRLGKCSGVSLRYHLMSSNKCEENLD